MMFRHAAGRPSPRLTPFHALVDISFIISRAGFHFIIFIFAADASPFFTAIHIDTRRASAMRVTASSAKARVFARAD